MTVSSPAAQNAEKSLFSYRLQARHSHQEPSKRRLRGTYTDACEYPNVSTRYHCTTFSRSTLDLYARKGRRRAELPSHASSFSLLLLWPSPSNAGMQPTPTWPRRTMPCQTLASRRSTRRSRMSQAPWQRLSRIPLSAAFITWRILSLNLWCDPTPITPAIAPSQA